MLCRSVDWCLLNTSHYDNPGFDSSVIECNREVSKAVTQFRRKNNDIYIMLYVGHWTHLSKIFTVEKTVQPARVAPRASCAKMYLLTNFTSEQEYIFEDEIMKV
jgi:hypothetical protein